MNDISHKLAQAEVENNITHIQREIRVVKPRVIVPLGNTALMAIGFSKWKIGECRGRVFPSPWNSKIIPSWHPAYVFRQFHEIVTCKKDWEKIARHSRTASMPNFPESFDLEPTIDDVERFGLLVANKATSGQNVCIALDIETEFIEGSPLDVPVKLIGMAVTESHAIVIPFIKQNGERYWETEDEELRAVMVMGNILENPAIEVMSHNTLFDILVLMNHGFNVNCKLFDTMIAQFLIYHPSEHSLEYVASIYSDFPPWKLEKKASDRDYRYYNARDCTILKYIRPRLDSDIRDNGLVPLTNIMMNTLLPTCRMMLNGLGIDRVAHEVIGIELQGKLEELTSALRSIAMSPTFNPESPDQVADLLFNKFKLKSQVKTKGKKLSTSEDVLNRLKLRYPDNEVVEALLRYRHYSQQYKTFIKNIYIQDNDRVHSSFKLHRVASGRYSSTDPNLQNLPARQDPDGYIRGLYRVKQGRILVSADYSQMELVIFAVLAEDEIWKKAFNEGLDVHVINAKALIGEYDPKYRTFIKNFVYGLIFGSDGSEVEKVAPVELIERITVPEMMQNIRRAHPAIVKYYKSVEEQVRTKHWIGNAFGRRRWFPRTRLSNADLRAAYNHPIQATAADIMHTRTPLIDAELNYERDWLVLQLHDAFYIETDESRVDKVAGILKDVMEQTIESPMGYEFSFNVGVEYGESLAKKDMKPWT